MIENDLNSSDAVRDSRAGDTFHYRWAARRCLKMLDFKSKVNSVVIEGSSESHLAGEYVIDVAEYVATSNSDQQDVNYFQLKHSIKRIDEPFELSELKNTIEGFAGRFKGHLEKKSESLGSIKYYLVTNRLLNPKISESIQAIAMDGKPDSRVLRTLKRYTELADSDLKDFCSQIVIFDREVDFHDQKIELHFELGALFSGSLDQAEINNLVALIQEKALPAKKSENDTLGKITREHVLKLFGVTDPRDLLPNPPEFEKLYNPIKREQHDILLQEILQSDEPIVIRAEGGVGKSVFCQLVSKSLPEGSIVITYDCFGAGNYLNKSQPRHRYRDALLQIANEIAFQGYCDTWILRSIDLEDHILRGFLSRVNNAADKLKKENPKAILAIFVDAADNAEMAAIDASDNCFAGAILSQKYPDNCRVVALCRPEREHLLKLKSTVTRLDLLPFSESETLDHLRSHYPDVNEYLGLEFHQLTNGNPRVQANALELNKDGVVSVMSSLGPGMSVDDQIAKQLQQAVSKLKDIHAQLIQTEIDAICMGLANFPPYIPVAVLAAASNVNESTIRGFVADLGRPLWISENFIQFRDEPTEYWFRNNFSANSEQLSSYIAKVKGLSHQFNYIGEILPSLLLKAGKYDELVDLALTDDYLPESPIDRRNVRLNRLQFAFKAALKKKSYVDAIKLALLAGEEVSGDKRQLELITKNVDLIASLQSPQRVQELAFRKMVGGSWDGSENIYSASLLSTVEDFKGDAQGYLRSAASWLQIYFDERKKRKDKFGHEKLELGDITEMAYSHLNLFGPEKLVNFISSWKPKELAFEVTSLLAKRLIDVADFEKLDQISSFSESNIFIALALNGELNKLGKSSSINALKHGFSLLGKAATRPKFKYRNRESYGVETAIIGFCEACAARSFETKNILKVLNHYFPLQTSQYIQTENGGENERSLFLRVVALRAVLLEKSDAIPEVDLGSIMPIEWRGDDYDYDISQNIKHFKEVIGALLPWQLLRTALIVHPTLDVGAALENTKAISRKAISERYRDNTRLNFELAALRFEVLKVFTSGHSEFMNEFIANLKNDKNDLSLIESLSALHAVSRLPHLKELAQPLELYCREMITANRSEGPESLGNWFIALARAVIPSSIEDSKIYFDSAIEAVSKFGDELVSRWDAIVAIANRAAEDNNSPVKSELAYQFVQCSELVGENVYKEKYWDRDEAIKVCFRLHKSSAFTALSRWRDRDIGRFHRQLFALLSEAIVSGYMSVEVAWCMSCIPESDYFDEYHYLKFLELCISTETESLNRQIYFDQAYVVLQLREISHDDWCKFIKIGKRNSLNLTSVDALYMTDPCSAELEDKGEGITLKSSIEYFNNWDGLFLGLNLVDIESLNIALKRFDEIKKPKQSEVFWQQLFDQIPEANVSTILLKLVELENVDHYDISNALSKLPSKYRSKISVQRIRPKLLKSLGKRFPDQYVNSYASQHLYKEISATESEKQCLLDGVLEGLEDGYQFEDGGTLFAFSNIASKYISPQDAITLLQFALDRFNEHIDAEFSDGKWRAELQPPEGAAICISGLLWSALGSPRSQTRWSVAHAIRRLILTGAQSEIDLLLSWMNKGTVDAFGAPHYPFYSLHAKQYLLIAISREVQNNPSLFIKHTQFFSNLALTDNPHVLIEKFAADIALSIEKAIPNTYQNEITEQLKRVGKSDFPVLNLEGNRKALKSPWHKSDLIDQSLVFHFSHDFDRYWFESLGDLFGITSKQVEELAKHVVSEWGIKQPTNRYSIDDPRATLWRTGRDRETWHSHSEYPKTDDYQFYLSYHAMLVVASKLLKTMPIVQRYECEVDRWQDWLQSHSISSNNTFWLSDRRDPPPVQRRAWVGKEKHPSWRWEIKSEDFLEGLLVDKNGMIWMNAWGHWSETDSAGVEELSIASAFVNAEASSSLLNALNASSNPHDFKLPNYEESDFEINVPGLSLRGWIQKQHQILGLDRFDRSAADISYPPYGVGAYFTEKFGLSESGDQRFWYKSQSHTAVLISEIWAGETQARNDNEVNNGSRIMVSLPFLQQMCQELNQHLIVEVQINRRLQNRTYTPKVDDEINYTPAYSKLYIFSGDGRFRDSTKYYQVGPKIGEGV